MPEQQRPTTAAHPEPGADHRRDVVLARIYEAGRESSAVTVMFHSAIAEKAGLGATESKTLDLLQRSGPLTAKELAERSGLAPASVTGLVDRLERKGFVRRVQHPTDRRRVLVEHRPEALGRLAELFEDWGREVGELCNEFSTEELEVVARFLTGSTARQRAATARLTDRPTG
ncbi:MarR family winged helix-turn-helix transcriptional regulator [Kitasatospora sp. DSM 101779]|jgi:DNA-binding MarR family transcriptional regulator|uniref:MarR family winged helix-turn-helix transcriptional regulator n=1 Tax=Kitasatospora sp. DSM 101779 TaxID=2853165 RepID=UPI0021D83CD5|nr:MarR family transcriptional regulator [Kitasatospora sp. DSM 101779]MCU7823439.1 MarR family transcriptional regulator [Kitasatospora sp. DSM 101779]